MEKEGIPQRRLRSLSDLIFFYVMATENQKITEALKASRKCAKINKEGNTKVLQKIIYSKN